MKRVLLYSFLTLVCGVILLPMVASAPEVRAFVFVLPSGWWHFLSRNLMAVTVNWTLVASGLLCSAFVLMVGHWLLSGIYVPARRSCSNGGAIKRWRWKWTLALYAGIWLLFVIAFGAAGVFRHTAWLIREKDPWYHERRSVVAEMVRFSGAIQQAILENGDTTETVRKHLFTGSQHANGLAYDDYSVLLFGDSNGRLREYLIIPTNPDLRERGGFYIVGTNQIGAHKPLTELSATLAVLESRYPEMSGSSARQPKRD